MEEKVQKTNTNVNFLEEMAQGGSNVDINLLKEMSESGVMYGHKKARTQPRFKPYIFATRNGFEIIDLTKTLKAIEEVSKILDKAVAEKKTVLIVGTHPASWDALSELAAKYNFPIIKNKWIGGLITNFKVVGQRLEYFKREQKNFEKGDFEKYTKKERGAMLKQLEKMKIAFDGLDNLVKTPDVLLVVDTAIKGHKTAIAEAKIAKIPVIAIIDNDDNPENVDYPIPANDHAKSSIAWVINKLVEGIK